MEDIPIEGEQDATDQQMLDQGAMDSNEEGFMRGYSEEEEVPECDECGSAIRESKVVVAVGGEEHVFCSHTCAEEFAESVNE